MKRQPDQAANRSFGLIMAGGLGVLAIIRSFLNGELVWWLAGVAVGFALVGFLSPKWLEPIRRLWMKLAGFLGFVNSRILMTFVYACFLTPIALLLRLFGKQPIKDKKSTDVASYWHLRRTEDFSPQRMERQF